ncbi:MAG TPA: response regulator transcription factor [Candidatus Angelobacter sp.]|jgi:two-component system KDP operon response regulator KdpE|nr:response regulator transcription factor [Candidatus Angelobacter sp.]
MAERSRILVVDDETQITRVLKTTLQSQGYEVKTATDGESALNFAVDWIPDLIVTDLSMPRMSGIELTRAVRERSQVPIIVLSVREEEKSKIDALDAGADDYVVKPFSVNELLARVRANLRRVSATKEESAEPVEDGDFYINPQSRMVRVRGKEIHLTPKEFDLLVFMARHPNKVLTHRVLLNAVWGGESVQQPEYLRVFINQLRKKIEPSDKPQYIVTDPWVGYRFHPTGEPPL